MTAQAIRLKKHQLGYSNSIFTKGSIVILNRCMSVKVTYYIQDALRKKLNNFCRSLARNANTTTMLFVQHYMTNTNVFLFGFIWFRLKDIQ